MTPLSPSPRYFFSLDAIRGVAALIVVLCHWQFFYYTNDFTPPSSLESLHLPLYPYLSMLYNLAPFAVDLFFLLSGFIFFWFYSEKIATRKTSFNNFLSFRFTRLYPVHFLMLMALVVLQPIMYSLNGHNFIIHSNDTRHFILHLFLIQTWGFEKTPALNGFNGPSWSASVEVLLYLMFFLLCWLKLHKNKVILVGIVLLALVVQYIYPMVGQGMYSFFLGALVYYIYDWAAGNKKITNAVIVLAILLWVFSIAEYSFSFMRNEAMKFLPAQNGTRIFDVIRNTFFRTLMNPVSLLMLALIESTYGSLKIKWMLVLGNASYAMYMIHFPLMVLFVIVADFFGINRDIFHSVSAILFFYAVLIPSSLIVHYYIELPVQQLLRKKWLKTDQKPVAAAA
jgi:peptidoglycan/LPS O-acetylase OafA/YrhL